jgi:divalent metal cation (Fe/Co/Zn/Cd) transporter
MMNAETSVRSVRMLHGVFLTTIALFVVVGEFAALEGESDPEFLRLMRYALLGMMVAIFGFAFFIRRTRVEASEEILMRDREDAQALAQWHAGNVVSFVCCETMAMFGLVLRLLSGSWFEAAPFFAVAVVLLLIWTPRAPFLR